MNSESAIPLGDLALSLESGIMSLTIKDKAALYAAYMPFVKNGGLFISTKKSYELGDEIFISLSLMEETAKFSFLSKIVWITPMGAQGNRPQGIGVQFFDDKDAINVRNKIETYLAGALQSDRSTHTL